MRSPGNPSFPPFMIALLLLALAGSVVAGMRPSAATPGRDATADVQAVHDVGDLWLTVSNFGQIGTHPGSAPPGDPPAGPSARWPGGSGLDHLYTAGLWVGGILLGERLVSTGQYEAEIRAGEELEDVIYTTAQGAPGGARYPWSGADDDGDGLEDEEILNGFDDDGDGLVDEDVAAASDQEYVCTMYDNTPAAQETYPDHTPLNLAIVQRTFQWAGDAVDDFVGFDYTIRNIGVVAVDDVYLGFFADFDLPAPGGAADDAAGSWSGTVAAGDGRLVDVHLAYMRDAATSDPLSTLVGLVLCEHPTDPAGIEAPPDVGIRSYQSFAGQQSFDAGGDPTNDDERYELLSAATSDPDTPPGQEDDHRILLSVGPFGSLDPGEEIFLRVAMVAGGDLAELRQNAAEAVLVARGNRFDRDGDPATGPDGREFQVPWLWWEEDPTPAACGTVHARTAHGGVQLTIEASHAAVANLAVVREPGGTLPGRRWAAGDLHDVSGSGDGIRATLVDVDPGGWPRLYRLVHATGAAEIELHRTLAGPPARGRLLIDASPNPFNPAVSLAFSLQRPQRVNVGIFDLEGRRIATLVSGVLGAGPQEVVWRGTDAGGRDVPSGTYVARIATGDGVASRKVQLVR